MSKASRRGVVAQPHDGLVKWAFSQREHVTSLLKAALPKEIVARTDWSSLRVEKDSFIDKALRKRYSDLVLSARMGDEPVLFYMLIEHQSSVAPLMVFRMLQYMTRQWEQLVRDKPSRKTLPPIVPLLLHHGKTGWTAATAFQGVVSGTGPARRALAPHIPSFELVLIDVGEETASWLAAEALTALARLVLWCLSVAHDDERFQREIRNMRATIVEALSAPNGRAALEVLLRYLSATHGRMQKRKLGELFLEAAGPEVKEVIVDFVEHVRREGKREGEQKGRRDGRAQTLLDQLSARFGPVPAGVKARIRSATDEMLSAWTLRVLTAPTLEALLEDVNPPTPAPRRPQTRSQPLAVKRKGTRHA